MSATINHHHHTTLEIAIFLCFSACGFCFIKLPHFKSIWIMKVALVNRLETCRQEWNTGVDEKNGIIFSVFLLFSLFYFVPQAEIPQSGCIASTTKTYSEQVWILAKSSKNLDRIPLLFDGGSFHYRMLSHCCYLSYIFEVNESKNKIRAGAIKLNIYQ